MLEHRKIEQIMIDALTAERKKLVKAADRYNAQLENPVIKAIELRQEIPKELAKLKAGSKEYTNYLSEAQAKLEQYQKELKAYEKRDFIKVNDKYMVCRFEIESIDSEISMIKWRMSRRA